MNRFQHVTNGALGKGPKGGLCVFDAAVLIIYGRHVRTPTILQNEKPGQKEKGRQKGKSRAMSYIG